MIEITAQVVGSGPRGEVGPQGPQGLQGEQGLKGDKGDKGEQGIQGIQGVKGDKGDKGLQGIQGIQGVKGDKGDKGEQGVQGIQGVQGEQGPKGDIGNDGYTPIKGTDYFTDAEIIEILAPVNSQLADITKLTPIGSGSDDTVQIQNAIDNLKNGGKIELSGTFNINSSGISIKSNIELKGLGDAKFLGNGYIISANKGSGGTSSVADNIKNVVIDNITFEHITKTFSEHTHLLNINAISNCEIKRCKFIGFRGDGIYIGSSNTGGTERHNESINIHDCLFDGVGKANRNGISVIDVNGLVIKDNEFRNCTASNMPGAIDIEPNSDVFPIIKNILISNNKFYNIGGNTGAINVYLPKSQGSMTVPVNNIIIEKNIIDTTINTQGGIVVVQRNSENILDDTTPIKLRISDNVIKNINYQAISVMGIKGAIIDSNYIDKGAVMMFGYTRVGDNVKDIIFSNNIVSRLTEGSGLIIFTADRVSIKDNTFIDCGEPDGTFGYALDFGEGTSSYIKLIGNVILSPESKTTWAIQKESSHTFNSATNIFHGNKLIGVAGQSFQADLVDPLDCVKINNSVTAATLPDSFPLNITETLINGADANLPISADQGLLVTHRLSSTPAFRKFIVQYFYTANNSSTFNYFIRQPDPTLNAWGAWIPMGKNYTTSIASAPKFIGQESLVSGIWYKAKGVSSTSDWVALNV